MKTKPVKIGDRWYSLKASDDRRCGYRFMGRGEWHVYFRGADNSHVLPDEYVQTRAQAEARARQFCEAGS